MKPLWALLLLLKPLFGAWICQPHNPSLWGPAGITLPQGNHTPGANPARATQGSHFSVQWAEPFPQYSHWAFSAEHGHGKFRSGVAMVWTTLDTSYTEIALSGAFGKRLNSHWASGMGYTLTNSWIPKNVKWYNQSIDWGNSVFLANVLTLTGVARFESIAKAPFEPSGTLGLAMNLHPTYQFFIETPIHASPQRPLFITGQSLVLGFLSLHNTISWPGPVFSFGIQAGTPSWKAGVGFIRPQTHISQTGYSLSYGMEP